MSKQSKGRTRKHGATFKPVSLARYLNWPKARLGGRWWKDLAQHFGLTGPQVAARILSWME